MMPASPLPTLKFWNFNLTLSFSSERFLLPGADVTGGDMDENQS